jgi:hypothetical protein
MTRKIIKIEQVDLIYCSILFWTVTIQISSYSDLNQVPSSLLSLLTVPSPESHFLSRAELPTPTPSEALTEEPMDMNTFNVSATLNIFRLIARPTLILPQVTISTFNHLPIPLNQAFPKYKNVDIRAVVLDKDNCFAFPNDNHVHKPYEVHPQSPTLPSLF